MPPIGEGAVPTISSTIGSGATPSHTQHRIGPTIGTRATPSHHAHTQHRTGPTIGSGATPSPFTIGSGARPTTTTNDPFGWTIGSGARPTTTTTTERRDPFADFNKPRTTSSLFPPRETRNDRSSSFNHISIFDEPRHDHRSHTVCHVETGEMTSTTIHGGDEGSSGLGYCPYIIIGLFVLFVVIGIILTIGFTVGNF